MKIRTLGLTFVLLWLPAGELLADDAQSVNAQPKIISTDTLLTFFQAAMEKACDDYGSPFYCVSKDRASCREALAQTKVACSAELKNTLPAEIDLSNADGLKDQIARCTMDKFIAALGPDNLDLNKCKK